MQDRRSSSNGRPQRPRAREDHATERPILSSEPMNVDEALRDPAAFVEGMVETTGTHHGLPLRPKKLPEQGRHIHLWSVKDHQPFHAVLAESTFLGVWTHYYDRRTLICTQAEGRCAYCKPSSRRWKGYIAAFNPRNRVPFVLEITRHCWQTCPALQKADGRLTRRVLKVWRAHDKKPAPMLAELLPDTYNGYLPSLHSCVPTLARVFQMEQARLCALALEYEEVDLNEAGSGEPPPVE